MYANAHETETSTPFRYVSFLRQPPVASAGVPCLNLHSFVNRSQGWIGVLGLYVLGNAKQKQATTVE